MKRNSLISILFQFLRVIRRSVVYPNIIKYLSQHRSIGILLLTKHPKWNEVEDLFLESCQDWGAVIVTDKAKCHSVLLPRFGPASLKEISEKLINSIEYERILINVGNLMNGGPVFRRNSSNIRTPDNSCSECQTFCNI